MKITPAARLGAMIDEYETSGSYAEVGRRFGLTRERARQILLGAGVPKRSKPARAKPERPSRIVKVKRSVTLSPAAVQYAERFGEGNVSLGLERIIDVAMARDD